MATEEIRWLEACIPVIGLADESQDSIDYLTATIRKARAHNARAEPQFKAYRPWPCPAFGCSQSPSTRSRGQQPPSDPLRGLRRTIGRHRK